MRMRAAASRALGLALAVSAPLACSAKGAASSADSGRAYDGAAHDGGTPRDARAPVDASDATLRTDASPDAARDAIALKPPILGLIDMGETDFGPLVDGSAPPAACNPSEVTKFASSFAGIVVNLRWSDLQPTSGSALVTAPLDQALGVVETYNATSSSPLVTKLRISGGFAAPEWAKAIGGPPLSVSFTKSTGRIVAGTLGRWWTAEYITAWRAFQGLLASHYDRDPLVREVAVTSCAASTDEPFVPLADPATLAILHGAGYSDTAQEACLSGALADYAAWKTTRIDFTFNSFLHTDGPPFLEDPDATVTLMKGCTVASQCILATHYLDNPLVFRNNPQNLPIYAEILAQAGSSQADFQTAAPHFLDWCGAINQAVQHHGLSVELWPNHGGFTSLSVLTVANLAHALATGTSADAGPCPEPPILDAATGG